MAGMNRTWEEVWSWFEQIEEPDRKGWMLNQILEIRWLKGISVEGQVDVLSSAPFEVLKWLKKIYPDCLKSETVSILNDHIKARFRPKRKKR